MANCKLCNIEIPDGTEYCDDCLDNRTESSNELGTFSFDESQQSSFDDDLADFEGKNMLEDFDYFDEDIPNYFSSILDQEEEHKNDELLKLENQSLQQETDSWEDQEIDNMVNTIEEDDESSTYQPDQGLQDDLNALLNGMDTYEPDEEELLYGNNLFQNPVQDNPSDEEDVLGTKESPYEESESDNDNQESEDDYLSLLNQISKDDPLAESVKDIEEMMNLAEESPRKSDSITDVGGVFSDALKAVSGLNDPNLNEDEILGAIEDSKKKGKKKKEKKKKEKRAKKGSVDSEDGVEEEKKPKKSFFQRIFGNVKDEKADISAKGDTFDDFGGPFSTPAEPPKPTKEKKAAKKKDKANKNQASDISDEEDTGSKKGKKEKVKKVKEKKPKKPKKEIMQVIDEIDEDVGRINRLGASIVFVFFALIAILVYVGTNMFNYTVAINHATNYFDTQKYTQAYYEVYGVKIKDEDLLLYEKIQTVMFVNKELDSYNNNYTMKDYPKALDSLLKGLKRYNKYIELANLLGIKPDMDYVRKQILAELNKVYKMSEADANQMIKIQDQKEYSLKVYEVVSDNDNLQSKGMDKNDSNN